MWRIVRPKSAALKTKVTIRSFGRRDRAGKLRYRHRMLLVPNIDNPIRQINLVAVRVGRFAVREYKSALQNPAVNCMESDSHARILRGRFETPKLSLILRIGKVQDNKSIATKRSVAARAAVFQFLRHINGSVQTGKRRLIARNPRRNQF